MLAFECIEMVGLLLVASREPFIEWGRVVEPTPLHLDGGRFVACEERAQASAPALRFGVVGVAGAVLRDDRPQAVDLVVLAQQVLPTERLRCQIPDSQRTYVAGVGTGTVIPAPSSARLWCPKSSRIPW